MPPKRRPEMDNTIHSDNIKDDWHKLDASPRSSQVASSRGTTSWRIATARVVSRDLVGPTVTEMIDAWALVVIYQQYVRDQEDVCLDLNGRTISSFLQPWKTQNLTVLLQNNLGFYHHSQLNDLLNVPEDLPHAWWLRQPHRMWDCLKIGIWGPAMHQKPAVCFVCLMPGKEHDNSKMTV